MSNDADVLLVDGPAHGKMVCMQLPMPSNIDVATSVYGGVTTYVRREFTSPAYVKKHHVALPVGSTYNDASIDLAIYQASFQPAWDLN